jgi:uncharacterized membrane protein
MADNNQNPPEGKQAAQNIQNAQVENKVTDKQEIPASEQNVKQESQQQTPQTQQQTPETQPSNVEMPEVLKKADNQPSVNQEEKLLGLASYIPLVALVTMLVKPDSKFIMLHGRQGLLISAILILGTLFLSILYILIPIIGAFVLAVMHIGLFVVIIFSMYQAFIGNWWKIPVLGSFAEMIPVQAFTKVTREAVMGDKANASTNGNDQNSADSTIDDFKQQTGDEGQESNVPNEPANDVPEPKKPENSEGVSKQ